MFDFAQTSFLNSRGSGRSRLADRDAPPNNSSNSDRDRENFSRWRDRQYFGPRRWLETALRENPYEKDSGWYQLQIFTSLQTRNVLSRSQEEGQRLSSLDFRRFGVLAGVRTKIRADRESLLRTDRFVDERTDFPVAVERFGALQAPRGEASSLELAPF
jgi:hypothetical protein